MATKKHAGGRPKIKLDYELIEKLAMIQCTQIEIASFIGVNVSTLQRDAEFCSIYKKGQENGKTSLRRIQFKLAEKNTAMAIFLGKNYLGQSDKRYQDVQEISIPEFENMTDDELKKLIEKSKKDEQE